MTEIALVIAVGKTRGKLSQVAFADWLAAQRAERLWTGSPAVHQNELHMRPPTEKFVANKSWPVCETEHLCFLQLQIELLARCECCAALPPSAARVRHPTAKSADDILCEPLRARLWAAAFGEVLPFGEGLQFVDRAEIQTVKITVSSNCVEQLAA